jgi:hypothetical protein
MVVVDPFFVIARPGVCSADIANGEPRCAKSQVPGASGLIGHLSVRLWQTSHFRAKSMERPLAEISAIPASSAT